MKHIDQKIISQTIDAMVAADLQLAWLKQVEQCGDVDWRRLKEIHDSFKYSHSGLGAGAQLAIAVFIAAVVGPMAIEALGTVGGSAATSLATTGTISTVNNKGNLGAALKETFSGDSLKNAAVAGVTAGLTESVYDGVLKTKTNPVTGKVTVDLSSLEGIGRFAGNEVLQGGTSAVLNKALGRDVDFKDALQTALFNTIAAAAFNAVGDHTKDVLADGSPGKVAIHALVGGLLSEATGGDFASGALAAGANEALIEELNALVKGNETLLQMASQLVGILAAGITNGDPENTAWVTKNATQYNFLNHQDVEELKEEAKNCDANNSCDELEKKARERSLANHNRLLECKNVGNCAEIRAEIDAGSRAINSFESQLPDGAASKILRSYTFIGGDNLNDWTLAGQLHLDHIAQLFHANDPRWMSEASKFTEQTGFNPFGLNPLALGALGKGGRVDVKNVVDESGRSSTPVGPATPKWDNPVSRVDGDFGPVNKGPDMSFGARPPRNESSLAGGPLENAQKYSGPKEVAGTATTGGRKLLQAMQTLRVLRCNSVPLTTMHTLTI
ncbi:DUF637 domain-containing protein [Pseudomonas otitidis]|uniref:DUF637 domain-containing protein n=1 Tax=Metapseudomonas otitidis TaxID=319939 RepID=UPI0024AD94ED|nr:DUF637 domain-containing protein [Pseudomonas otitidis]MDI6529494.1 DUF637 domain-containing protein [Pseudomonas otitidis]